MAGTPAPAQQLLWCNRAGPLPICQSSDAVSGSRNPVFWPEWVVPGRSGGTSRGLTPRLLLLLEQIMPRTGSQCWPRSQTLVPPPSNENYSWGSVHWWSEAHGGTFRASGRGQRKGVMKEAWYRTIQTTFQANHLKTKDSKLMVSTQKPGPVTERPEISTCP